MKFEMMPSSLKRHIIHDVFRKVRWTFGYQLLWGIESPKLYSLICPIGARIILYCIIFRKWQKLKNWLYWKAFYLLRNFSLGMCQCFRKTQVLVWWSLTRHALTSSGVHAYEGVLPGVLGSHRRLVKLRVAGNCEPPSRKSSRNGGSLHPFDSSSWLDGNPGLHPPLPLFFLKRGGLMTEQGSSCLFAIVMLSPHFACTVPSSWNFYKCNSDRPYQGGHLQHHSWGTAKPEEAQGSGRGCYRGQRW